MAFKKREGSMNSSRDGEKGFTLIELMITVLIVLLAVVGNLSATTVMQITNEELFDRTVAIQDANRVLEQMRTSARIGTFPGNVTGAFPNGGLVAMNNLTGEQIQINYVNTAADPLDVTVTVRWNSRGRRALQAALRSLVTQRLT
jgi:prepilin-type N-terminal cleavage/methylation domain-containing protein